MFRYYSFLEKFAPTEESIDPIDEKSMLSLQEKIENGEGPFYLNATEVRKKDLKEKLTLYKPKQPQF